MLKTLKHAVKVVRIYLIKKHCTPNWGSGNGGSLRSYLPSCDGLQFNHKHETMNLLQPYADEIEEVVFLHVADRRFNLKVDLIFYDMIAAAFYVDQEDDAD